MKRITNLSFLLMAATAIAVAAGDFITPEALLKDASKLDGKAVVVRGVLIDFKQKTSKKGNPYFTFKLQTKDKDNPVSVYGQGKLEPEPKDKAKVEISGKFAKEKSVGTLTFKNEVDVTSKSKEDKFGVKILENGR